MTERKYSLCYISSNYISTDTGFPLDLQSISYISPLNFTKIECCLLPGILINQTLRTVSSEVTLQSHAGGSYVNKYLMYFHWTFYYRLISFGLLEPWNVNIWQHERNINERAWFQSMRSCLLIFWEQMHLFGQNHLGYKTSNSTLIFCIILTNGHTKNNLLTKHYPNHPVQKSFL